MGLLKLEQRQEVESDQELGQEIQEVGEHRIEETVTSAEALESIEAIDDDVLALIEDARQDAEAVAGT